MRETRHFQTRFGERILEVATFINEDGQEISYITHDSIMNIVSTNKFIYKFAAKVLEPSHSVVECEMTNPADGWTAVGVGESFYKELDSHNKANPSSIAYKRAFDNVALILLGLPDKYLGSYGREIPNANAASENSEPEVKKPSLDELTNVSSESKTAEQPKVTTEPEKKEPVAESSTPEENNNGFKATEENFPTEKKNAESNSNNELLATVLDFGPAKGMSVKEILDNPTDDKVIKFKSLFGMIDKIPDERQRNLLMEIKKIS